jgi:hypothetical protein
VVLLSQVVKAHEMSASLRVGVKSIGAKFAPKIIKVVAPLGGVLPIDCVITGESKEKPAW